LVQTLQYAKGKQVNIYTGCKFAFATLQLHEAIYKERGLMAVWEPSQVAVMYYRGHQRGTDNVSRDNRLSDQGARRVAEELSSPEAEANCQTSVDSGAASHPELHQVPPCTSKEEEQWAKDEKGIKEKGGWWKLPDQRLFVPSAVAAPLVKQHELMRLGKMALEKLLNRYYFIPKLLTLCAQVSTRSALHGHKNNASQGPQPSPGIQITSTMPFEDLGVDFTEVKPCQGYRYLLVLVCTYSGWVEASPAQPCPEKAQEVVKAL
jgi:hypothetical protein